MTLREALIDIRKQRKAKGHKPVSDSLLKSLGMSKASTAPIPQAVRARTGKYYDYAEIQAEWERLLDSEPDI